LTWHTWGLSYKASLGITFQRDYSHRPSLEMCPGLSLRMMFLVFFPVRLVILFVMGIKNLLDRRVLFFKDFRATGDLAQAYPVS
jgi:hypothetical protein